MHGLQARKKKENRIWKKNIINSKKSRNLEPICESSLLNQYNAINYEKLKCIANSLRRSKQNTNMMFIATL